MSLVFFVLTAKVCQSIKNITSFVVTVKVRHVTSFFVVTVKVCQSIKNATRFFVVTVGVWQSIKNVTSDVF